MGELPNNLVPLPTQPWEQRPDNIPLELEEARTALWLEQGNITRAAARLKVTSARLRALVKASPYLTREMEEAREQILDKAETVVREALDDEDASRKDTMARFVLSSIGRVRGYGNQSAKVNINAPGGKFIISWQDEQPPAPINDNEEGPVIDGAVNSE